MLQVRFAEANSRGLFAPLIGWFDYSNSLHLSNRTPTAHITNMIDDGFCISFDLSFNATGNPSAASNISLESFSTPVVETAPFGTTAYTGIPGNVALYMPNTPPAGNLIQITVTLSNIRVKDCCGESVRHFFIVASAPETTTQTASDIPETWSVTSNGTPWDFLDRMPSVSGNTIAGPTVRGINTATVLETGVRPCARITSANAFLTQAPTQLTAVASLDGTRQGFAFGIIRPRATVDNVATADTTRLNSINTIRANSSKVFHLPLKHDDFVTTIIFNGITYSASNEPLLITGRLGSYLFSGCRILFSGTASINTPLFDTFLLITKCDRVLVITFAPDIHI